MMSDTYKQQRAQGYSADEARNRARIIDAGHAHARSQAAGLNEGDHVAVYVQACSHHPCDTLDEGVVIRGELGIGGVLRTCQVRRASLPYRKTGAGDGQVAAVLADGTELIKVNTNGSITYAAGGRSFGSVCAAAVALTPAA